MLRVFTEVVVVLAANKPPNSAEFGVVLILSCSRSFLSRESLGPRGLLCLKGLDEVSEHATNEMS